MGSIPVITREIHKKACLANTLANVVRDDVEHWVGELPTGLQPLLRAVDALTTAIADEES